MAIGLGEALITYTEMAHYQNAVGYELTPFEQATIREMSVVYSNGLVEYRKDDCPQPFVSREVNQPLVNDAAANWVKMMIAAQKEASKTQ